MRHHGDVTATGGAGVLHERDWMQFHDARGEFAMFRRRWRLVLPFAGALRRIVEGPVLDVALAAFHVTVAKPILDMGMPSGSDEPTR